MNQVQARKSIVEFGRRLHTRGLIAGTEGNISIRCGRRVVITPSGANKGYMHEQEMVVTDLAGRVTSGGRPSGELPMHLACYHTRPDVGAVVHAHPPTTIAFSIVGVSLDQLVIPESVFALGPVKSVGYATPTTLEVVAAIRPWLEGHNVLILDRHGSLTLGATLEVAYNRLESLEHTATILHRARSMGLVTPLTEDQSRRLLARVVELGIDVAGFDAGASSDADSLVELLTARVQEVLRGR